MLKKIKNNYYAGYELIGIVDALQNKDYSGFYFENKIDEMKKLKDAPKNTLEKIVFYCGASAGILGLFCKKFFPY